MNASFNFNTRTNSGSGGGSADTLHPQERRFTAALENSIPSATHASILSQ
jgi:hypothetical protein